MGRSFGAEENINSGCHWSWASNLRHGDLCSSRIDHQLKKVSLFYCASPRGKNAYSFSAKLYVNKFMKISWLSEVSQTVFLILKSNVLQ